MKAARTWQPLFTWRAAITQSDLAPTTRLVALTMSLSMNEIGGSAYPSATTLAAQTGLGISTVRQHRGILERSGWITCIERGGFRDGRNWASEYRATIPPEVLAGLAWSTPPADGGGVLQELEGGPPADGGGSSRSRRGVLQELDPNSLSNSPSNSMDAPSTKPERKQSDRGTRIPRPFVVTAAMKAWARAETPDINLKLETESFVDWAVSASGPNAVKKDWERAWKNWMRREQKKAVPAWQKNLKR